MIASTSRPTRAKVDLQAIHENLKTIQAHLPQGTRTLAVVKANAYGHGAVAVANAIANQVDGFCVSNVDEALELRQAGLDQLILILGVTLPDQVPVAIKHQLTLTVAHQEWLDLVRQEQLSLQGLQCHIKVDTGMGRIGLQQVGAINALMANLAERGAIVTGIFTHFATADEADDSQFQRQLSTFKEILAGLERIPDWVHTSNSATSIWHSDTVFQAVRLGIGLYGLNPSGRALVLPYPLKPALSLVSSLIQVKTVEAGQSIGYGSTYKAKEKEVIGTVPIGYADGWIRSLQGFHLLVDGQPCEIVGRISMDQLTIRLPMAYPVGTPVTLIGRDGQHIITATDVADKMGTINYEVVCLISDRVPREYE